MDDTKITKLAQDGLDTLGYDDCFITELKVNANKIEIFLDSDDGISYEKCGRLSRNIEAVIDEAGWWGGKYTIEVSSAGIGRPLVSRRQYPKNIGRQMQVKTSDGEKVKGELSAVTDEGITLQYEVVTKEGKKKIKSIKDHLIAWDEIAEAKIKVSFK